MHSHKLHVRGGRCKASHFPPHTMHVTEMLLNGDWSDAFCARHLFGYAAAAALFRSWNGKSLHIFQTIKMFPHKKENNENENHQIEMGTEWFVSIRFHGNGWTGINLNACAISMEQSRNFNNRKWCNRHMHTRCDRWKRAERERAGSRERERAFNPWRNKFSRRNPIPNKSSK